MHVTVVHGTRSAFACDPIGDRSATTPVNGRTAMARTARSGHTTTDHDFIRGWVEERGGWPARVKGTGAKGDAGLIRIDFPGFSGGDSLERIGWDEWFQGFDGNNLAFLHRDMSHGGGDLDRFNKLISRTGDEDGEGSQSGSSRGGARGRTGAAGARSSASRTRASSTTTRGRGRSSTSASASDGGSSRSSGGRSSSRSTGAGSRSSASKSGSGSSSSGTKSGNGRSSAASSRSSSGAKASGRSSSTSSRSSSRGRAETASNGGAKGAMAGGEMHELLMHELGDLLFAEKQFLAGTKTLAKEALDPMVKARVEEHVTETEGQIERLKQAFQAIGERPKAEKCEAALGLREEHDSFKSEEKPSKTVMSAFSLGSGLRVEHYEIAAYRTAIALAGALGQKECASILKENLKEEMAMAAFLEKNAPAVLKRTAAMA
jgi:ferritin-like metal-binding protein YciE